MDEEKKIWLHEIGVVELGRPYKYYCATGTHIMYYSEDYIENTPLEELKKGYERNFEARKTIS